MVAESLERTSSPSVDRDSLDFGEHWFRGGDVTGGQYPIEGANVIIFVPQRAERSRYATTSAYPGGVGTRVQTDSRAVVGVSDLFLPGEREELAWEARNAYPEVDSPVSLYFPTDWARSLQQSLVRLLALIRRPRWSSQETDNQTSSFRVGVAEAIRRVQEDPEMLAMFREMARILLDSDPAPVGTEDALMPELAVSGQHPWLDDLRGLKQMAYLTDEELGHLFDASRSNVQGWLNRGQGMKPSRQQHLQAVMSVLADASARFGGQRDRLRYALFSRITSDDMSPFDYLVMCQYRVARGLLVSAASSKGARPLLRHFSKELTDTPTRAEREAALEELSPTPRFE